MAGFTMHRSKSRYDKINTTMAQKGIHWLAPTTVAVALLAGVLFAVGHHLFYASLRGQPVHNDDLKVLGGNISRQQINITAGTIFAFLVNFCLGTALTTAYAQVFWKALLRQRATLETWDAAFSATSNIFFIGKVWIWWHFPLLGAFAIIAWLLPFATTFPPGTLSVGIKRVDPPFSLMQQVPNVDFSSLNYVAPMTRPPQGDNSELNTEFLYKGASTNVQRIANQVAETGVMLPITPPYPNASYALEFYGPSLACSIVPDAIQSSVHKFVISKIPDYCTAEPGVYGYSSWQNGMAAPGLPSNLSSSFSRLNSNGIALNVVAFPHMMELHPGTTGGYGIEPYPKACEPPADPENDYLERVADATMLQCVLRNATYQVTFNYTNAQQSIEISSEAINSNPINRRAYVRGDGTAYTDDVHDGVDCSVLAGIFNDNVDPERICLVDTHILKQLSYQGIFDAFANLFNGSISRPQGADSTTVQTNVQGTILVDTPELSFLNPYSNEDYPSLAQKPLQGYIQGGNLPLFRGLVNNVRVGGLSALPRTMESLFENITISMMSSKTLQPNVTSNYLPPNVTVTLNNLHPVYEYASRTLLLAYGIAIGFAVIVAAFGLWSVFANEASYSTDFSTIFRISRAMTVSEEVKAEDSDGRDPLPEYLRKAKVWLASPEVKDKEKPKYELDRRDNSSSAESPTTVERTAGEDHQGG